MVYLKSILAGIAGFMVTTIISSAAALALIARYPQAALRIFPAQRHDLQWGSYYYVNFPFWQIVVAGVAAFAIGFGWTLRRSTTRTQA
jgi:hypothetical protein